MTYSRLSLMAAIVIAATVSGSSVRPIRSTGVEAGFSLRSVAGRFRSLARIWVATPIGQSTVALGDHPRQEGLEPVNHAPEVDAERPLPVPVGGRLEPTPDRHAGVVAEDVDTAERREGAVGERLHLGPVAHVGTDGERASAPRLDSLNGLGEAGLVDVGHDDGRAFRSEALGQSTTDAAGAAGDDAHTSPQRFDSRLLALLGLRRGSALEQRPQHRLQTVHVGGLTEERGESGLLGLE